MNKPIEIVVKDKGRYLDVSYFIVSSRADLEKQGFSIEKNEVLEKIAIHSDCFKRLTEENIQLKQKLATR